MPPLRQRLFRNGVPGMGRETLRNAKKAKNDEFYTQISDIANECSHYKRHFKGKTIFCNCDDPDTSNFWRYFHINFSHLGLKKLVSTHFVYEDMWNEGDTYKMEYTGGNDVNYTVGVKTTLRNNGDFRSNECIDILKETDIVITNPPFSLFREYVAQLMEYGKKYLIIGSMNAITYKEIFKEIKENNVWLGINNGPKKYIVPDKKEYEHLAVTIENGVRLTSMGNTGWFTNLDVKKRHEEIIIWKKYSPEEYPYYDNYNAVEVGKVAEIPADYTNEMGVPITFLDKYNPDQFEIVGLANDKRDDNKIFIKGNATYLDEQHKSFVGMVLNGKATYARILIKRKQK